MSKKLIFCFDGTCNEPSDSKDFFNNESISNILKIHIFLGGNLKNGPNTEMPNQRSFYYSGVGTIGNWFQKTINSLFAPLKLDIKNILTEANKDLKNLYKKGDEIYIFGFSRGAAVARIFAAKNNDKEIKFLGVFDTVAAIGKINLKSKTYPASGVLFENGEIGRHIKQAVHLVSIDEKRITFQPTLMNKRKGILEVWFAGVHSDIGGGYWFDGLSDITLDFMLKEIRSNLKILALNKVKFEKLSHKNTICKDDINIKALCNGSLHEQKRTNLLAKKTLNPRMVRVSVNDQTSNTDYPIIHYTVCERFKKVSSYRPHALRNVSYKIIDENKNIGDMKTGIVDL